MSSAPPTTDAPPVADAPPVTDAPVAAATPVTGPPAVAAGRARSPRWRGVAVPGATSFWDSSERWWHVVWLGVVAVVALVVVTADVPPGMRWSGLAALAALVLLYLLVGARAVGRDRDLLAGAYLLGVTAALVVLLSSWGPGLVTPLLMALFPQIWALMTRRAAVVAVVVVPLVLAVARAQQGGWGAAVVRDVFVEAVAQFAIALILGLWITGMVRESEQRAVLLAELVATREELAAAERARGVLAERERVAREIHDTLAQGFTSVIALAQATAELVGDPGDPDDPSSSGGPGGSGGSGELGVRERALVRSRLRLMEDTARTNLAEARGIVEALRPVDLRPHDPALRDPASAGGVPAPGRADLAAALGRVAARFTAETGVVVAITGAEELPALAADTEVVLLRAVQEGLSNVRRHAAATRVEIAVATAPSTDGPESPDGPDDGPGAGSAEEVVLRVVDDGRGPGGEPRDGGYGLEAMASRLREVGGRVRLSPGAGGGSVLHVRVPR